MSVYIVCQKKRNNPRMDVRICEKKCDLKGECKEFLAFHKSSLKDVSFQMPASQGAQMGI